MKLNLGANLAGNATLLQAIILINRCRYEKTIFPFFYFFDDMLIYFQRNLETLKKRTNYIQSSSYKRRELWIAQSFEFLSLPLPRKFFVIAVHNEKL